MCVIVDGVIFGLFGMYVDFGCCFGSEGQFGVCVNQLISGGDIVVDDECCCSNVIVVLLDWCGDILCLFGDFLYQWQWIDNGCLIVLVSGSLLFVVLFVMYNYVQLWSFSEFEDMVGIVCVEYDFLFVWMVYVLVGVCYMNEYGDYYMLIYLLFGMIGLCLSVLYKEDVQLVEVGVCGCFMIGFVLYFVIVGVLFICIDSQFVYMMLNVFLMMFYDLVLVVLLFIVYVGGDMNDLGMVMKIWLCSIVVFDMFGFFDDCVLFMFGVWCQLILVDNFDYMGVVISIYSNVIMMLVFGFVVKLWCNVLIFVNCSEVFVQGEIVFNIVCNVGQVLLLYWLK